MTDYQKYINALRKCAKEHENDRTFTGNIIVSDLCKDTANLLEELEQQPCEDCISRQAVLDCLTATGLKKFDFILDARDKIKNLPPVTPQQKVGHWEKHSYFKDAYICSSCNTGGNMVYKDFKYCPNCGAKMEAKDNG